MGGPEQPAHGSGAGGPGGLGHPRRRRPLTAVGALPAGLGAAELVEAVRAALDAGVAPGSPVGVAVSGGPDSTALAHLLPRARPDLPASVLHVRHGLRDDAEDARVAAQHAGTLDMPYHERAVTVARDGEGVEAAARRARYRALAAMAREHGIGWLLVAHTADDQAETVVLNLARGSGLAGLAGMAAVREHDGLRLARPLLRLRRADVRAFVAAEGLRAVTDPTNAALERRRTRARLQVLPALAALSGGPGDPVGALTRLAELARDDAEALDGLAGEHAARSVRAWGPVRAAACSELAGLPRALTSRVVRMLLAEVRGGLEGLTAEAVRAVLELPPGGALHVPGGALVSAGQGWVAAGPPDRLELAARIVPVPGRVDIDELGIAVAADLGEQPPAGPFGPLPPRSRPARDALPWARLPAGAGLVVRGWRAGDRIRLPGGVRSVADLLAACGVPRPARPLVPVVAGAGDAPLWVPGVATADVDASGRLGCRVWVAPCEHGRRPG